MSDVLKFYKNQEANPQGLYLKDLWSFNTWELENRHQFIQWLFPIELKSNHCEDAPVLTSREIKGMLNDKEIRENILTSLSVLENFLGLDVPHSKVEFSRPKGFQLFEDKGWLTPHNHNYIRITRALHSLVILGFELEARELYSYLENRVYASNAHMIKETVLDQWRAAMDSGGNTVEVA